MKGFYGVSFVLDDQKVPQITQKGQVLKELPTAFLMSLDFPSLHVRVIREDEAAQYVFFPTADLVNEFLTHITPKADPAVEEAPVEVAAPQAELDFPFLTDDATVALQEAPYAQAKELFPFLTEELTRPRSRNPDDYRDVVEGEVEAPLVGLDAK